MSRFYLLLKFGRSQKQCEMLGQSDAGSSPEHPISFKLPDRFRNRSNSRANSNNIFRRVNSKRKLYKSKNKSAKQAHCQYPADTFSLSDDEVSSTSSLFSPVNTVVPTSFPAAPLLQQLGDRESKLPHLFNPEEDKIIGITEELIKTKEILNKTNMELLRLQQGMEDLKKLHIIDLELKDVELGKKILELEKLQAELVEAKLEIETQTQVIDALATANDQQKNMNWYFGLLDPFLELV
ncbi:hypothetical protein IV203_032515 [Nitzschia inconspicua]|uniref:Uncharacterized protein n=1 Tax=Nitzschia inconspicua TaxID=303405 RepID=A0A9K3PHC5_9STRA|nr:hypothetical protein IV203_032515 [Nitzschia inconspicua]